MKNSKSDAENETLIKCIVPKPNLFFEEKPEGKSKAFLSLDSLLLVIFSQGDRVKHFVALTISRCSS